MGCLSWTYFLLGAALLAGGHMEAPPEAAPPAPKAADDGGAKTILLEMPGIKPEADNSYVCTSVKVPDGINYIVHYEPKASASIAHHVLLFGCNSPASDKKTWACGEICGVGEGPSIYYAWAKNAAGLDLPKDVGFRIGGKKSRYLVLQVHYAKAFSADQTPDRTAIEIHYTPQPQPYMAGIYIILSYSAVIPAHTPAFDVDVTCQYRGNHQLYPFAFRTHTHKLGVSVGGYLNNGSWHIIGEGNPQLPQAFYPVNTSNLVIKPNDIMSGRCTYDSSSYSREVGIGGTDHDEMCNFYIMYYTPNNPGSREYYECFDNGENNGQLLESRPDHARMRKHGQYPKQRPLSASRSGADRGVGGGLMSAGHYPVPQYPQYEQQYPYTAPDERDYPDMNVPVMKKPRYDYEQRLFDYGYQEPSAADPRAAAADYRYVAAALADRARALPRDRYDTRPNVFGDVSYQGLQELLGGARDDADRPVGGGQSGVSDEVVGDVKPASEVTFDPDWPRNSDLKLGHVSAVGTDSKGHVWVFHRANRQWTEDSFDLKNVFNNKYGVIKENTILHLDKDGKIIEEFGANLFYMPHGLHVDKDDNLWLTDVAMHQVFMIPAGKREPTVTLGQKMKPGSDLKSFCKPTDVATLSTGEIFVSDGYCNSRVLKFKSPQNLTLIGHWGKSAIANLDPTTGRAPPGTFNTVHSITAAEDKGLVCVADREDGRIQCFDYEGVFKEIIESPAFGTRVFAATYHPRDSGTLYVVNGPDFGNEAVTVAGFTVDLTTGTVVQRWAPPKGLTNPHDVAVSRDGRFVYVAEIGPNRVWKFNVTDVVKQGATPFGAQKKSLAGSTAHGDPLAARVEPNARSPLTADERQRAVASEQDMLASVIIGALLVIPILVIVAVTVVVRLRKSGRLRLNKSYKNGYKLNLGSLLRGRHKGFDRLSTEESDELEHLSDSEAEDYARPNSIQHT